MTKTAGWVKPVAAVLLIGALGAAAALVALRVFFPEPRLRALIVDGARKQLGREIKLERIALGLRGLYLDGLQISEAPDFGAGTFMAVERFRLRPSWKALLRRDLVVATVEADGLKVMIVKRPDATFNFSSLGSAAPVAQAAAPAAAPAAARPEFSIKRIRVLRGAVVYKDEVAREAWDLSDVSLSVDDFGPAEPFDVDASLRARGKRDGRPVDVKLSFAGRVDPARGEAAKVKVRARRLSLETEGLTLKASGELDGLAAPKASFEATLAAAGKTVLEAGGEVRLSSATGGDFLADVKAQTPGLDTTLLAKWLPAAGVPAVVIPAAQLTLQAQRRGSSVEVKTFVLTWKEGRAEGRVTARELGSSAPVYNGSVTLSAALPAVAPGQYPFLKLPPRLSLPAAQVDAKLDFLGDAVKVTALKVAVPQGAVSVAGAVAKLGSAKPVPDLSADLALALPAVKTADLPIVPGGLPPSFVLPAVGVTGTVQLKGDDLRLRALTLKFRDGRVVLDGAVLRALGDAPRPELEVAAELSLPALTDKDLPFPGIPPGLELPPTRWEGEFDYVSERLRVRKLRLRAGGNDVAVEGAVADPGGRMAYDLLVKCRSFVLEELTRLTPATRGLELKGAGFVAMSVTGNKAKPIFAGKAQFRGAGATVAGLPLAEFAGTASFDAGRLDVPNLKGKVGEGNLDMDLTVKDWAKSPEIQLEAALDRFDLGRFLEAQKRYKAEKVAAPGAGGAGTAGADGKTDARSPALRTRGSFTVGALTHPNATVKGVKVSWDLSGVTPELRELSGTARLGVEAGRIKAVNDLAAQSPVVKVLMLPLLIVQKIARLMAPGVFPDFSDVEVRRISGDYLFKDGVMTLRESHMDSSAAQVSATGAVDLPKETLDLIVTAQVGRVAPIDVAVKGTVAAPKTDVKVGKFFTDQIDGLLKRK